MMKKAVHIIFLCLFFLFGLQCLACNKMDSPLHNFKIEKSGTNGTFLSISKPEKGATFSSLDKLQKKKRFSRTFYNTSGSLSKCNGVDFSFGAFLVARFDFSDVAILKKNFSEYSFSTSFCHRKLLSIFYSFQAFW